MRITHQICRTHTHTIFPALLAMTIGMTWICPGMCATKDSGVLVFKPRPAATAYAASIPVQNIVPLQTSRQQRSGFAWSSANSSGAAMRFQNFLEPLAQSEITAAIDSIQALELTEGPYAADLAPMLLVLAWLYRQQEDHKKALAVLSRAGQVFRASFGLNSPDQFPAIELGIESYLALQDYQQALEQQQALVNLHQSHYGPDALETVPRLITLGDMYFAAFERTLHKAPGGGGLTLTDGPEINYVDVGTEDIPFIWLQRARTRYVDAITILLKQGELFNPLLLDLESSVIETLFLQAHRRELEKDPDFFMSARVDTMRLQKDFEYRAQKIPFYRDGENAMLRMLSYLTSNPGVDPIQVARIMLQLGDWHLMFDQRRQSREMYAQAREFLRANGVGETELDTLLNPSLPVQLPTFIAHPHSLETLPADVDDELNFDGYIDVAFTVTQYGKATGIKVLDKSADAVKEIETRLKKVLHNAPFRPRVPVEAGQSSQRYEVRYSFARL